jgi:hypothetical protein
MEFISRAKPNIEKPPNQRAFPPERTWHLKAAGMACIKT